MADEVDPKAGKWPRPLRQFWWDMLPAAWVPEQSGIMAPDYVPPSWISDESSKTAAAVDLAAQKRKDAEERAKEAEQKATRLLQVALTLLALSSRSRGTW